MPCHASRTLNAFLVEIKSPAYAKQRPPFTNPDEPVLIRPFLIRWSHLDFVDQRKPPAVKGYGLRSAAEPFCGNRRGVSENRFRVLVHQLRRVTLGDELQAVTNNPRHPIVL